MKKVRAVVIIAILFITNLSSFSQRWEIGFGGGVSYYVGDLNPTGHFKFPNPAGTVFFKRVLTDRWVLRGGFTYMGINADDVEGDWGFQHVRNLNFRSHVLELSCVMELNFFPFAMNPDRYMKAKIRTWTPYMFGGIGAYYYSPFTVMDGQEVELQPLGTEGQGTPTFYQDRRLYSRVMPCIPFGLGVKFNIKKRVALAIEYGMRLTFNDYLDDVSMDYAINSEIFDTHGANAGFLSDRATGDYAANSNDFYQRGIKTDLDWIGYLGVSLSFYIKDPTTCPDGGIGTSKRR